jgi:hypothetical protein
MFNLFDRLRSDEENEQIEAEQASKEFIENFRKLPPEEQQKVKEEILIQQLMRIEDVVNTYILTCKSLDMELENLEDFIQLAKDTEKSIAFSDMYKEMPKEVRSHLKAYLGNLIELIKASFNSHKF